MERVACNLCGSEDSKLLIHIGDWTIVQCNQCGLAYLNPRPSENELGGLYTADYFSNHVAGQCASDDKTVRELIASRCTDVEALGKYAKRIGRLLDIGCGTGFFLAAAKEQRWDVQGVEISTWAAQFAREKLGLCVITGKYEDVQLPRSFFDAVTMYHCLEHLPNPLQILAKVNVLLKPNGLLVVKVPNFKSFDARYYGRAWRGWDVPFHLYHFSQETLVRMLREAGFEVEATRFQVSLVVVQPLKKLLGVTSVQPLGGSVEVGNAAVPRVYLQLRRLFSDIGRKVFSGRDMTIFARKNAGG